MMAGPLSNGEIPNVVWHGGTVFFRQSLGWEGCWKTRAMTLGLALWCWSLVPLPTSAQGEASLPRLVLHVGYTRSSLRAMNVSDTAAAFRVFAQTVGRRRGYEVDPDARIFESAADCESEIKKGGINIAILDTWDYLGMDIHQAMEPEFVHVDQGEVSKEYLLLTRRGSGLLDLADLRGKDLLVLEGKGGNLSRAWLDTLLMARHLGTKESFFGKMVTAARPAAAVLPVFFGAKPACLVDRAAFQIMSELNPQVGSNLAIAAVSDKYLENVTCLSRAGWPSERARQDVIRAMAELHLEPNGRQILELFKLNKLVPFKDEYLETARKLRAVSDTLMKEKPAKTSSSPTQNEP